MKPKPTINIRLQSAQSEDFDQNDASNQKANFAKMLGIHFHFQNTSNPTIFTLLLSSYLGDTTTDDVVQILFNILFFFPCNFDLLWVVWTKFINFVSLLRERLG